MTAVLASIQDSTLANATGWTMINSRSHARELMAAAPIGAVVKAHVAHHLDERGVDVHFSDWVKTTSGWKRAKKGWSFYEH